MNETILKVTNVSKQYRLGSIGTGTLRNDFKRFWYKILKKEDPFIKVGAVNDREKKTESSYVWALKDIDFSVNKGEVIGILGKNGAGKSTLLKVLSKITYPTKGKVEYNGKIASLLEVGTGFHEELTARENIFLNGAILGMKKSEIASKLDEIISFSGCLNYIDTPVKRFSSGMRVRLAFSVAAFLDPDIFIIDEVLAVGDFDFQAKAIQKIKEISETKKRTILFVSHDMQSIVSLCSRCILLSNGEIIMQGPTNKVVDKYINDKSLSSEGFDFTYKIKEDRLYIKTICSEYKVINDGVMVIKIRDFKGNEIVNYTKDLIDGETLEKSFSFDVRYLNTGVYSMHIRIRANSNITGTDKIIESPHYPIEITKNETRNKSILALEFNGL